MHSRAGLSPSRTAVPEAERSPSSWFLSAQQQNIHSLVRSSAATPLQLPGEFCGSLQQMWSDACHSFQKAYAAVHLLKDAVRDKHVDLSTREATHMCAVAEHLLYIMRCQQSAVHDSCRQVFAIDRLCQLMHNTIALRCEPGDNLSCRCGSATWGPTSGQKLIPALMHASCISVLICDLFKLESTVRSQRVAAFLLSCDDVSYAGRFWKLCPRDCMKCWYSVAR